MNQFVWILSLVVFLPAIGALALALFPRGKDDAMKLFATAVTAAVFLLTVWMAWPGGAADSGQFQTGMAEMQLLFNRPWIPALHVEYLMGTDGISFPLVLLTSFLSLLAMGASWSIDKHVRGYCILFLLLETGMLGTFLALDFFLFYVFWEVMLLPMYFLIGIWGGPRREYAAVKFFLYTLVGSVGMLVAALMLYFNSDLTELTTAQRDAARVLEPYKTAIVGDAGDAAARTQLADQRLLDEINRGERSQHTFNILAWQLLGQTTDVFDAPLLFGWSVQRWAFLLLLVGFLIKVPAVPLHTWLPDAHVEAPTPISMILAGVLLKMGGYGIIRFCLPICPEAARYFATLVCGIGVLSMVYGAFAALAQRDFKRLVAYSSVSHMGYVVLGLGMWTLAGDGDYWKMAANGAMYQMIGHGISSAGMFFMVGVLYERVHHRNLDEFGGLFAKMPAYSGMAWIIFLAAVGLPGLCGFIGEAFVVLPTWKFSPTYGIIAAATVILTAGYVLWAFQRVYLGAEYKGPHGDHLTPLSVREWAVALPLVVMAFVLGVAPEQTVFPYMKESVNQTVQDVLSATSDEASVKTALTRIRHEP